MNLDKLYDKACNWLISFGPKLLLGLVIFFTGLWLIKKLSAFINQILSKRRIDPSLRPFLTGSLSLVLQVLLVFAVMQIVGIQLTIFAALIGAIGVAGGLALSGTLQNFTSGILILLLKPFRVGDNIITQGEEGVVTMIRIFYTIITTFDNRAVIVPNSKLSNEVIINLSREGKRRLDIELAFNYSQPFSDIRKIIEKLIDSNNEILKEPAYRVGILKLEKDSYTIMINAWIKAHGYVDMKMKLQELLMNALMVIHVKAVAK